MAERPLWTAASLTSFFSPCLRCRQFAAADCFTVRPVTLLRPLEVDISLTSREQQLAFEKLVEGSRILDPNLTHMDMASSSCLVDGFKGTRTGLEMEQGCMDYTRYNIHSQVAQTAGNSQHCTKEFSIFNDFFKMIYQILFVDQLR